MDNPIKVSILLDKPKNCNECPFYGEPHLAFGGSDPSYCRLLSGDHNIWECIVPMKEGTIKNCPLPNEGGITAAYTKAEWHYAYHLPQPKNE